MAETEEMQPKPGIRGPVPAEVRAQILDLHQQQVPLEVIAQRVSRSLQTVTKIVSGDAPSPELKKTWAAEPAEVELDLVVDFLAELPEEALQEMLQLAQLTRQHQQLLEQVQRRLR